MPPHLLAGCSALEQTHDSARVLGDTKPGGDSQRRVDGVGRLVDAAVDTGCRELVERLGSAAGSLVRREPVVEGEQAADFTSR